MVDDEAVVRTGMARVLEAQGLEVEIAGDGSEALETLDLRPFAVVFLDIKMPGMNGVEVLRQIRAQHPRVLVIMITGYPTMESAIECLKLGAVDYLVKPFRADELEALLLKALEVLRQREEAYEPLRSDEFGIASIVGNSSAMQKVFAKVRRAAPSDSTVLITGESGTGKELVARAIHRHSLRSEQAFVPVDCSALVESLLESELFGHVKGSFTGAYQTKHGLFELANHGTF
ncbi:MAG TPA: sigma-54-dependent Fis family transcriptional regulator, partial [Syntrophobacteraceae bacterium]|nr:sigma-54-dependent Fis family transcriptional regulator [Syntrophobacteraceae bacterium]